MHIPTQLRKQLLTLVAPWCLFSVPEAEDKPQQEPAEAPEKEACESQDPGKPAVRIPQVTIRCGAGRMLSLLSRVGGLGVDGVHTCIVEHLQTAANCRTISSSCQVI